MISKYPEMSHNRSQSCGCGRLLPCSAVIKQDIRMYLYYTLNTTKHDDDGMRESAQEI